MARIITREELKAKGQLADREVNKVVREALLSTAELFLEAEWQSFGGEEQIFDRALIEVIKNMYAFHYVAEFHQGETAIFPITEDEADFIKKGLYFYFRDYDLQRIADELEEEIIDTEVEKIMKKYPDLDEYLIVRYLAEEGQWHPDRVLYNISDCIETVKEWMEEE